MPSARTRSCWTLRPISHPRACPRRCSCGRCRAPRCSGSDPLPCQRSARCGLCGATEDPTHQAGPGTASFAHIAARAKEGVHGPQQLGCALVNSHPLVRTLVFAHQDERSFIVEQINITLQLVCASHRFWRSPITFMETRPMHKVLIAATVLGLLGLPILASAQSTNQPSTNKDTAANPGTSTKKAVKANGTKQATKRGSLKRHAQGRKKNRLAMHGHKMRHATARHGKRFAKSHGGHRQVSAAKRMHQASAKSPTRHARAAVSNGRTSIHRRAAYRASSAPTQRNCGQFMYWKNGKCNDARNKSAK